MAKVEIMGSWFPTGYHGHFRSKSRNDFLCEYRHLAKPLPPKDFTRRLKEPAARHIFSHHDNKQSFLNDALIFQEGLGKRRIKNNTLGWKPDLLHWMPQQKEVLRQGPLLSDYKRTYRGAPKKEPYVQQIIQRPKTSFDDDQPSTTSYRYAHGRDNPNRTYLNAMANHSLVGNQTKKIVRTNDGNDNVASCLNWYHPPTVIKSPSKTLCNATMLASKPDDCPNYCNKEAETTSVQHEPTPPSDPKPPPAPKQAFCE